MELKARVLSTNSADQFSIVVQERECSWQVERYFEDFKQLKTVLKQQFSEGNPSWKTIALFPTADSLTNFLSALLTFLGEKLWECKAALQFLDNAASRSIITELKVSKLQEKINRLEKKSYEMEQSQRQMLEQHELLASRFEAFILTQVSAYGSQPNQEDSQSITRQESFTALLPSPSHRNTRPEPRMSILSVVTNDSIPSDVEELLQSEEAMTADNTPENSNQSTRTLSLSAEPPVVFNSSQSSKSDNQTTAIAVAAPTAAPALPSSIYLPAELLPLGTVAHPLEAVIDSTLQKVCPQEAQLLHRESIVLLMKKLVRLALGATAFSHGMQEIGCVLPDDPIRITVILCKNAISTWHAILHEYLTTFGDKAAAYGGCSFVPVEEDEVLDPYFSDLQPKNNHFLGNVAHIKQNLLHSITLVVDSIAVEISANNRGELCLLSFAEEAASLFHSEKALFKRSFLLIRAWWVHETQALVGTVIRHYLNDYHLFVMLLAIFNQYHQHLHHVMQVFSFFLAEYSGYDGMSKVITIFGMTTFQTKTSNQPVIPLANRRFDTNMISEELLDKYWILFNISHAQDHLDQKQSGNGGISMGKRSSSSDEEDGIDDKDSNDNKNTSTSPHNNDTSFGDKSASATTTKERTIGEIMKENMRLLAQNNIFLFDRATLNIAHPLSHTNMMLEKLSQRRISRLVKAFQAGAVAIAAILRSPMVDEDVMQTCFMNIRSLSNLWNPRGQIVDITAVLSKPVDVFRMIHNICYCNLMVESVVNNEGLLLLTMEVLATKGALPVGEIGKILAELTSIPNLSIKLKERYGGLKKFLEMYIDAFVVTTDHPFNPNVLLRGSLAPEHLDLIDRGIFPHQLVMKAKKQAQAVTKKRNKSIPSSTFSSASFAEQQQTPSSVYRAEAGFTPPQQVSFGSGGGGQRSGGSDRDRGMGTKTTSFAKPPVVYQLHSSGSQSHNNMAQMYNNGGNTQQHQQQQQPYQQQQAQFQQANPRTHTKSIPPVHMPYAAAVTGGGQQGIEMDATNASNAYGGAEDALTAAANYSRLKQQQQQGQQGHMSSHHQQSYQQSYQQQQQSYQQQQGYQQQAQISPRFSGMNVSAPSFTTFDDSFNSSRSSNDGGYSSNTYLTQLLAASSMDNMQDNKNSNRYAQQQQQQQYVGGRGLSPPPLFASEPSIKPYDMPPMLSLADVQQQSRQAFASTNVNCSNVPRASNTSSAQPTRSFSILGNLFPSVSEADDSMGDAPPLDMNFFADTPPKPKTNHNSPCAHFGYGPAGSFPSSTTSNGNNNNNNGLF